jgi:hypothetical protein
MPPTWRSFFLLTLPPEGVLPMDEHRRQNARAVESGQMPSGQ